MYLSLRQQENVHRSLAPVASRSRSCLFAPQGFAHHAKRLVESTILVSHASDAMT